MRGLMGGSLDPASAKGVRPTVFVTEAASWRLGRRWPSYYPTEVTAEAPQGAELADGDGERQFVRERRAGAGRRDAGRPVHDRRRTPASDCAPARAWPSTVRGPGLRRLGPRCRGDRVTSDAVAGGAADGSRQGRAGHGRDARDSAGRARRRRDDAVIERGRRRGDPGSGTGRGSRMFGHGADRGRIGQSLEPDHHREAPPSAMGRLQPRDGDRRAEYAGGCSPSAGRPAPTAGVGLSIRVHGHAPCATVGGVVRGIGC
jgi:hypothetical protein